MSFQQRIQYFLVHTLFMSNRQAQQLIADGCVAIDNITVTDNCPVSDTSEIKVNGNVARAKKELVYVLFHKPAGYESSLNETVADNLSSFFKQLPGLAIAGRLDKQSEGLMLLSNDGKWVESICNPKSEKEKEYLVTLDRQPNDAFFKAFTGGLKIGYNVLTRPCNCTLVEGSVINVILTEGKNRQIRRMCKALGYSVIKLKRMRIDTWTLNDLKSGEFKIITI